eukprot:SAG11_NODE_26427_length_345_cov_1.044715_1_plen_36_part_10
MRQHFLWMETQHCWLHAKLWRDVVFRVAAHQGQQHD